MKRPTIQQLFEMDKPLYTVYDSQIPPGWPSVVEMLMRKYSNRTGYQVCRFTQGKRVERTFGNALPRIENGRILDIGCSRGITTTEISDLYPDSKVVGIDLIPYLDAYHEFFWKREDKKGIYLIADGFEPPFPNESFEAVFCMNNIYHEVTRFNSREQRNEGYKAISKLVKPEGHLLISGTERRYGGHENFIIFQKKNENIVPIKVELKESDETLQKYAQKKLDELLELYSPNQKFG